MELFDLSIKEARAGLRTKDFSAEELVFACLERIKKVDPNLHAFLTVADDALAQAQKADELISRGESKPLLGIPIALKDLFSTANVRTTAGAKIIDNYIPPYDGTVVQKLKEAGAIVIGKTNEDAWGHGSSGENSDYAPTKNPYDLSRVPGGSSSGSAAAVAAGECLAATGTDTGSSIRLPAAFCNLVGIKPTYGRVSRYGIIAMASSFDCIGHLTRTVYDNALIYEITAGRDLLDSTTRDIPVPQYTKSIGKSMKGAKLGLPKEYMSLSGMDVTVKRVTEEAISVLRNLGAEVVDVSLPHTQYAMACYYILVPSEVSSNLARFDGIRYGHNRETFGTEAKRRITLGTYTLSAGYYDAYYLQAQKMRTLVKKDFEEAFLNIDALIAPSSPTLPFKLGEKANDPLQMYLSDIFMCPVNIAGVPALNVPCGFINDFPVGMQIIGPQFGEERLYQIAGAYEQATQWYKVKPKL